MSAMCLNFSTVKTCFRLTHL